MDAPQFIRIAKALADPRRFEILEMIASRDEVPCKRMVEVLPVSQATISHHLKELATAGLIEARREGQCGHYRACPEVLVAYTAELERRLRPPVPALAPAPVPAGATD
jgi:ArsR family transcriptional regulator